MTTLKEMRESIETKLESCEAIARAIESQLESTREQAYTRVEYHKKRMAAAAARMAHAVEASANVSTDRKTTIRERISELQLLLMTKESDAPEAYIHKKGRIIELLNDIEHSIARYEAERAREWEAAIREWVHEEISLEAELEYSQLQYQDSDPSAKIQREDVKRKILSQLDVYHSKLKEKKRLASEKLKTVGNEIESDLESIKDTFKDLFPAQIDSGEQNQTRH